MSAETRPACWNCAHWDSDTPPIATGVRRPNGSNPDLGVCTLFPPVVATVGPERSAVSMFPPVHRDRICGLWLSVFDPDPDGGRREPAPVVDLDERRRAA